MSNFQWVWRYSCLNVTRKKPYKRYEGKANDLLIAFIGYVNDLNELQQFKVFTNPTIDFNAIFNSLGNSTCSCPEVVLAFLLYEGSTIHNASDQFISWVYFFFVDFAFRPSTTDKKRHILHVERRAALLGMLPNSITLQLQSHLIPSPECLSSVSDARIRSVRANFKQLYLHTHLKLDTCL